MTWKPSVGLASAFFFVLSSAHASPPVQVQEAACQDTMALVTGAWEGQSGKTQILFDQGQIILHKNGALSVATILKREPCALEVRYQGLRAKWAVHQSKGPLLDLQADEPITLRPLATAPPELDLNSFTLPAPIAVSPEEMKAIEGELQSRVQKDQEAAKNPALRAKRPEIIAENLRYLRDLTRKYGWIDIPRFGERSASAAILLAKHGSDLLLMKAALPIVERDVKEHGGSGEMFSVLYDELQITLGHKQRYGTQIGADQQGKPYILPLEDPEKVDAYRKEIGILSFQEYLKLASENMGGMTLRVAGSDE